MPTTFGVIGASGLLGRQLVAEFLDGGATPDTLRLFATAASAGEEGEDGEWEIEDTAAGDFRGLTVAILAVPREAAEALVPQLEGAGIWCVDASGLSATRPYFPGLHSLKEARPPQGRLVSLAHPISRLLALMAARAPSATWASFDVLCAASTFGRSGVERLHLQSAQLLNGQEPDLGVFPHRLAFNVIPATGPLTGHATALEVRVGRELGAILPSVPLFQLALVPTFHGLTALATMDGTRRDAYLAAVAADSSFKVVDAADVYPMPTLAMEDDSILIGRFREAGTALQFVACNDGVASMARALVAVARSLAAG